MSGKYDDIIHLPHHVSKSRPRMSMQDRAAQFMPFAALTGHDAAIKETARITEDRLDLTDDAIAELDRKLQIVRDSAGSGQAVRITYFLPDSKKDGGKYVEKVGVLRRVDDTVGVLIFEDGSELAITDVADAELLRHSDSLQ